jgi:CRISPR-associated endonuclease/helicase Cas3
MSETVRPLLARKEGERFQTYACHVEGVERIARRWASRLHHESWGQVFARVHDIGKTTAPSQRSLDAGTQRPPHAPYGARLLLDKYGDVALPLAGIIYGHHSGLYDLLELKEKIEEWDLITPNSPLSIPTEIPDLPGDPKHWGFWTRMIYSACVDADRLDAEHFTQGPRAPYDSLETLWERFEENQTALMKANPEPGSVNACRNEIYRSCLAKSSFSPGYFTATIPTGGGKTRSLVAFALQHAIEHDLDRIVIAVPYTSIIEQNAAVYRDVFGDENVVEHHSLAELENPRHEKSTENWDAPIIITTTVQLFESLYAARSGKARKIHRLAESVIILDEMQSLPAPVIDPCLEALRNLMKTGSSIVCSTATNPGFDVGPATELIDNPVQLAHQMKRVEYHVHPEPISHEKAAELLGSEHQGLFMCNTVDDAREIASLSGADLLTSRQVPFDRGPIIERTKAQLKAGIRTHLVSTQLIEAGVNLDFPAEYRVAAPVPSIIQAAGRCNREGKLDAGMVHIVVLKDGGSPLGAYKTGRSLTIEHLSSWDFHDPFVTTQYFNRLFNGTTNTDENEVLKAEHNMCWKTASERMKLIEDGITAIVPRNDEAITLIDQIRSGDITRAGWRRLQQYTTTVYDCLADEALEAESLEYVGDENDLAIWTGPYTPELGLFLP